jgi:hypothetical protein
MEANSVWRYLTLFAFFATSCGPSSNDSSSFGQPSPAVAASLQTDGIEVEVAYAPAAAPYVGSETAGAGDSWSITTANLKRLYRDTSVVVPSTLGTMHALPSLGSGPYTTTDVTAIATKYRTKRSENSTVTYFVVFLDGYYRDTDGSVRDDVLGVSVGHTGVIAMFKPVIAASGSDAAAFVEQAALTHELGHAAGFVDNGVTMSTDHLDATHGRHCTNPRCVMYWENEGAAAARAFTRQYVRTGSEILFGDECLADADRAATSTH